MSTAGGGESDWRQCDVAIQAEDRRPPHACHHRRADLQEPSTDKFGGLAEIPNKNCQSDEHLLLAGLDTVRVQVAELQQGKDLLRDRRVVAVRRGDHRWDLQGGERFAGLLASVVGGAVKD